MSKSEREIMGSRDARDWADFFVRIMRENNPKIFNVYQESALHAIMFTWFANAMMAMHDSIHNNEIKELREKLEKAISALEFYGYEKHLELEDYEHGGYINGKPMLHHGKLARQALKELKEGE